MGKGGTDTTTQTTTNNYDKKYNRKMARIAKKQANMGKEQWQLYKEHFMDYEIQAAQAREELLPQITAVSQKLYSEAIEGVDVDKRADQAGANVQSALQNERESNTRTMSRYGIDPGSSRFKSSLDDQGVAAATMTAGARNQATENAERENHARLGAALGMRSYAEGNQADPLGAGMASYGQAASGYGNLASKVLSTTQTRESPTSGFWDFAGNAAGTGMGGFAGSYGANLGSRVR